MKTPKEFDYDLWTTGEGKQKKYFTRVKRTGEVCEVCHEVMKFLRSEEKRLIRELEQSGNLLCLETAPNEDFGESWITDPRDFTNDVTTKMTEDAFLQLLTPNQRDVYLYCIAGDMNVREYARAHGLHHKSVSETIIAIREKYKKNFI